MVNWSRFTPTDFEYDFESDKLAVHRVSFEEAVECFFSDFEVRRNKSYKDRYQLIGRTVGGRQLKIIFQLKDDESAWEQPIQVRRSKTASVTLPSELAARAAFLARLHREASLDDWLRRIIQERIDLEEAAFAGLKRDLATKTGV